MPLSPTASISASQINTEMGYSSSAQMSIGTILTAVGKSTNPDQYNEMRGYDRLNFGQNPSQWQEGWVYPQVEIRKSYSFWMVFDVVLRNYSRTDSISGTCYWSVSTSSTSNISRDSGSYTYSAAAYTGSDSEQSIYASGPMNPTMYVWLSLDNVTWMYVASI